MFPFLLVVALVAGVAYAAKPATFGPFADGDCLDFATEAVVDEWLEQATERALEAWDQTPLELSTEEALWHAVAAGWSGMPCGPMETDAAREAWRVLSCSVMAGLAEEQAIDEEPEWIAAQCEQGWDPIPPLQPIVVIPQTPQPEPEPGGAMMPFG